MALRTKKLSGEIGVGNVVDVPRPSQLFQVPSKLMLLDNWAAPGAAVDHEQERETCTWKTSSGEDEFCSADRWPFPLTSMVDDRTATILSAASSPLVPSTRRAGPNASFLIIF